MASLSEILYAEDSAFNIFLQSDDLAICTTTPYRIVIANGLQHKYCLKCIKLLKEYSLLI